MIIIRHLKGLNVLMLPCLESCGAWLSVVSKERMKIWSGTGASRCYNQRRADKHERDPNISLGAYDRNAVQSQAVRSMVELMRRRGLLTLEHRQI